MFSNTFKAEKTNRNFTLQANLLWILKSISLIQFLFIFSLGMAIFVSNKPNSLKCDRSTDLCILNLASTFDSFDVEIPIESITDARIKTYSTGDTIELTTTLGYPVQLSSAIFSKLDNPTEKLETIKNFINDESISTLYIEQDNSKSDYLLLAIASFIPISGVVILSFLLKDTTFNLSQNSNEFKIITESIWQQKQETYAISDIKQVKLDPINNSQSKSGMYKLALLMNSGKEKKIVVIDSSKVRAVELVQQVKEFIFYN